MAYQPPHKRNQAPVATKVTTKVAVKPMVKKEEFPSLTPQTETKGKPATDKLMKPATDKPEKPMMNFASLFKNAIKKKKPKPMKWGLVLLTKKGVVDSLTPEEREEQRRAQEEELQEALLLKTTSRLETQRNVRREFDANYESPPELTVSTSEDDLSEEEEEIDEDFEEDEFEPEN